MKHFTMTALGMAVGITLSLPNAGLAVDERETQKQVKRSESTTVAQVSLTIKHGQTFTQSRPRPGHVHVGQPVAMPRYVPPRRGTPHPDRMAAGGTRGRNKTVAVITLLAPNHPGLTTQSQPVLYWFTPTPVKTPIEITLIEEDAIAPLLETRLDGPVQPGVQRVRLADYGVQLMPGTRYQWSVALVVDTQHRSKDVIAMGTIERIRQTSNDARRMAAVPKPEAPFLFAELGLWYDAVMAISELIEASPSDLVFQVQRAALLEQVGLSEISAYDITM